MGTPYAEVIGDPVAHSKSPLIHNFWLERLGMEAEYRRTRVTRSELTAFLETRRADPDWRGCNVTMPHKEKIVPLLDEYRTWGLEAVNCVVRQDSELIGYNTDMEGFGRSLPGVGHVDVGAPVCVIGAGGAARAVIAELDVISICRFKIICRDPAKVRLPIGGDAARGGVFAFGEAPEAMRGCHGLVNASPLGMSGFEPVPEVVLDALPLLAPHAFVFDMAYGDAPTKLVRRAAALGFDTVDGLTMLVAQAASSFAHFFGSHPPAYDPAGLRRLLTS
ncbi:MAG TPA: shikimate dehydrogenase [Allosphingosinicella sp.]|nr:shikimate dehydrogenase [Allosphingosinicella sp.]